ncbi:MAG: SAM-dependent chlorinase/fluorinase [Acidimicrobiia bacterium]|nr:SAM-dependent chlorinase/fluorinase [Acidimicrobiia bacterium]
MLPVSFISDFGHTDEFVGVVHGVIARIEPEVRVIDITHGVPAGDVRAGALALLRAVQYMPQGIVLAVVDPGVGTDRRAICARTAAGLFVGPDNGLLAPAVAMVGGADLIVSIENPELRLPAEGNTFAGRDVFAPAAAVLAAGQASIEQLGPPLAADAITPMMIPLVEHRDGGAVGEVLWVDGYGNAQTNITPADLAMVGLAPGSAVVLRIGAMEYPITWAGTYGDVLEGEGMVHVDSYGQIAVAVRGGSALDDYPLENGIAVTLKPVGEAGATPLDIN